MEQPRYVSKSIGLPLSQILRFRVFGVVGMPANCG